MNLNIKSLFTRQFICFFLGVLLKDQVRGTAIGKNLVCVRPSVCDEHVSCMRQPKISIIQCSDCSTSSGWNHILQSIHQWRALKSKWLQIRPWEYSALILFSLSNLFQFGIQEPFPEKNKQNAKANLKNADDNLEPLSANNSWIETSRRMIGHRICKSHCLPK